ncbi:spore coat U domain-containing protein [Pseudomonas sp. NPDC090202]|uniref:Csu type fimbrial protein n=1 Tax=unclassified Pseudomonas TaxID=196821 RepID=UPI00382519CE
MQAVVSRLAVTALALGLVGGAQAATTVTGQITSSLILTSACLVNGSAATSGLNFGTLNFGTTGSLFTTATGQVLAGGGGAMSIQCSAGSTPVLKVRAGAHDGQIAGGSRALADASSNFVPYDLYTDAGFSTLLPIDGTVALGASTGAAQTVNLYGRAVGRPGLPAGTYTDTIAVELTF